MLPCVSRVCCTAGVVLFDVMRCAVQPVFECDMVLLYEYPSRAQFRPILTQESAHVFVLTTWARK